MIEFDVLSRRLRRVSKEQTRQTQHQINPAWYSFLARPTCPPSTSMTIHGGTCIESKSAYNLDDVGRHMGLAWTVPSMVRDLTDDSQARVDMGWDWATTEYTELTWVQANSYRGGVLLLLLPDTEENPEPSDWRLRLLCYQEEYTTAHQAETRLTGWLNDSGVYDDWQSNYWPDPALDDPDYQESGMPLCGIILHNNGILGTGRYFLEIDVIDRGRSYTWPRDLRPQWIALY